MKQGQTTQLVPYSRNKPLQYSTSTCTSHPAISAYQPSQRCLCHHAQNFEEYISSSHGRQLSVCVICGGDLHEIGRDDVESIQTSQDGTQLAGGPASSLRRACGWSKGRVNRIDIDGEINGPVANSLADLLDDAFRANCVNLACFDALEPRLVVVYVVCRTRQRRADRAVLSKKKNITRIPTIRMHAPRRWREKVCTVVSGKKKREKKHQNGYLQWSFRSL